MSRPDLSGTTVGGHFDLKKRLGAGHFGDVYLCENTIIARETALKVVAIDPAASNAPALEAQLQNLSSHAHIVKVWSAVQWQDATGKDYLLIEMEYVPGGSLEDAIRSEISIGKLLSLMKNVLFALDHAHPTVIHRDVKPANILLGGGGQLSDFGIAMVAATGAKVSDLQYVLNRSPECFPPTNTYDVATDVFAAGLTLYRGLNLIRNWKATLLAAFANPPGVLAQMKAGTVVTALGFHPRVPKPLQKVVKKACAQHPAKRYPTAAAFRDALESLVVLRDWQKVSSGTWECFYSGAPEQLLISARGGVYEVSYTRNGRRKTAYTRTNLSNDDGLAYVYQVIARTTFT